MTYETLRFEVADGVARIALHRPESANAMNEAMINELSDVAITCDEDLSIRVVLVCGDEQFFCAGGDLTAFNIEDDRILATVKTMADHLHTAILRLSQMQVPLIAAVAGTAAGAGLSLVGAADLVVAGKSAKFVSAYTAAGLSPDGSSTFFLPRRIGVGRTRELMLTNRVLTADEALRWGLVNQVVEDIHVLDASLELAHSLASGPTRAFSAVKRLLDSSLRNDLETQLELEAQLIAESASSADGREGVQAFLEKRKPRFTGR